MDSYKKKADDCYLTTQLLSYLQDEIFYFL